MSMDEHKTKAVGNAIPLFLFLLLLFLLSFLVCNFTASGRNPLHDE